MGTRQQGPSPRGSGQRRKSLFKPSKRLIFMTVGGLIVVVFSILWLISAGVSWSSILPVVVLTAIGTIASLGQWLSPSDSPQPVPEQPDPITPQDTPLPAPAQAATEDARNVNPPAVQSETENSHSLVILGQQSQGTTTQLVSAFLFCVQLTDVNEFYGRVSERNTILSRTHKGASTSIIGRRRIGKTWLLQYTQLELREKYGQKFRVGFLDASAPGCNTVSKFIAEALKELGAPKPRGSLELDKLEHFVKELKRKMNCTPVLCIDEFEGLAKQPQEFNLDFFNGLRSIAQYAGLVLVTASKKPLIDIVIDIAGDTGKTSPFFNIFEQITLHPFIRREAEIFASEKCSQVGFTVKEQGFLLQYGRLDAEQWSPLRLQLVGKMLLEDKTRLKEDPYHYQPDEPDYWKQFERRLEEKYRGVVRE